MITPSATNPAVTEVGDMISRACMLDDDQAAAMAAFARGRLKLSRVAVLYDQAQPYSTGLATAFGKAFSRLGGTITGVQRYNGGDQDLQAQLEAIRDAKAQAVFVPGFYADVGGIAKQLRALGVTAPLLGTDGWDSPQLAQIAGAAIDGSYYAGHFAADDPRPIVKAFAKQFQAKHTGAPDALAALGYDAARLLFDAMARARSLSGTDLAEAIAATKGFEGVTGSITMGAGRNPKKPATIVQLKAGKPAFVTTIAPP
jgi:branched-chain amino acid transport system substrate-binding protein